MMDKETMFDRLSELETLHSNLNAARAVLDVALERTGETIGPEEWEARYFVSQSLPRVNLHLHAVYVILSQFEKEYITIINKLYRAKKGEAVHGKAE